MSIAGFSGRVTVRSLRLGMGLACVLFGAALTCLRARAADKPSAEPTCTETTPADAENEAPADACFDLHLLIMGDVRLAGRDQSTWRWGGGAKLFLGNRIGQTAIGGLVGFRALSLRESRYDAARWVNQEALMAYDVAASAETRFGRRIVGGIIGGHLGAAFVPASKVRFRPSSTVTRVSSTGQTEIMSGLVACTTDRLCQLNRDYGFALSVGARGGVRFGIGERRELTLQVGVDGRVPVRAQADLDVVLLLGFASY